MKRDWKKNISLWGLNTRKWEIWDWEHGISRGKLYVLYIGWISNSSISNSMDLSLSKLQEIAGDRGAWRTADHGVTQSQTQLRGRTATGTTE